MVHYRLFYFDIRGSGETIRLILQFAKQPYEEERLSFEEWPQRKGRFPYGKVPVLEVDEKPLAESFAIVHFLAKQYGLAGEGLNAWEQAKLEELAHFNKGVGMEMSPYFQALMGYAPGDREALHRDVFLPGLEKCLPVYAEALREAGNGFVARCGVTWVDFLVSEFLQTVHNIDKAALDKWPELEQYRLRVAHLPQIKSYIEGRKHTLL